MGKLKFEVLGKEWQLKVLSSKKYVNKHGYDSLAVTLGWKRKIFVHGEGVDKETLIHELLHAYLHEMCLKSSNDISTDDLEEIFCEFLSKRGRELLDLADSLLVMIEQIQKEKISKKLVGKSI
jgi:hypothetical protein